MDSGALEVAPRFVSNRLRWGGYVVLDRKFGLSVCFAATTEQECQEFIERKQKENSA